ncbi:MAG TPA: alpha/beta hydrolase [Pyrinomonadaceae bacterium]|nr:alpha/beta hydrolase [Pyrinomonadaceae bacterium]
MTNTKTVAVAATSQDTPGQKPADKAPEGIEGTWFGIIRKLRLVLKVTKGTDGKLAYKLYSLEQGDLPVDTFEFTDPKFRFEMKAYGASFEGALNKEGEIAGTFKQGNATFPLVFKRVSEVPTLSRPQEPKKPYPYDEEEVTYENKRDKVRISGTLTRPKGARGPVPAVLLITGSGPQDRDEAVMGHRPFLVLADYLTRKGIAVLRVDDRGVGGTSAGTPNDTSENYVADVLAGIEFLKTRKEINAREIGLVGHSEGGMVAPLAAAQSNDVAFLVLIAGPGLPGDRLILLQNEMIARVGGMSDAAREQMRLLYTRIFALLKEEKDNAAAEKKIREALTDQMSRMTDAQKQEFAEIKAVVEAQGGMYVSPWFRYFLTYDPRPALMKVKVPVLAINGERDLQVPADENLSAIGEALKAGGNKDYAVVKLPRLNHLLQTSMSGAPAEYAEIEETISPTALDTITNWILKHTVEQNKTTSSAK